RGPAEGAVARLARVLGLSVPLGRVVAVEGAVAPLPLNHTVRGHVESRTAPLAGPVLAGAPLRSWAGSVARERAAARSRRASLDHLNAAPVAGECPHLVSSSTLRHITHSTATVNPLGVMRYA